MSKVVAIAKLLLIARKGINKDQAVANVECSYDGLVVANIVT